MHALSMPPRAQVTLDSIVRVLTGRHAASTARNKRLLSNSASNVLLYITGHGGNEFMKIQVRSHRWHPRWSDGYGRANTRAPSTCLFSAFPV